MYIEFEILMFSSMHGKHWIIDMRLWVIVIYESIFFMEFVVDNTEKL